MSGVPVYRVGSPFPGNFPCEFAIDGTDVYVRLSPPTKEYLSDQDFDPAMVTPIAVQASLGGVDALVGLFLLRHRDGSGSFVDVWVDPGKRRRGLATAVYDEFERRGVMVEPSQCLDEDGALFWEARHRNKVTATHEP